MVFDILEVSVLFLLWEMSSSRQCCTRDIKCNGNVALRSNTYNIGDRGNATQSNLLVQRDEAIQSKPKLKATILVI